MPGGGISTLYTYVNSLCVNLPYHPQVALNKSVEKEKEL